MLPWLIGKKNIESGGGNAPTVILPKSLAPKPTVREAGQKNTRTKGK